MRLLLGLTMYHHCVIWICLRQVYSEVGKSRLQVPSDQGTIGYEVCIAECPVESNFSEDSEPAQWVHYIELNAMWPNECPPAVSN